MVEYQPFKLQAGGSSPPGGIRNKNYPLWVFFVYVSSRREPSPRFATSETRRQTLRATLRVLLGAKRNRQQGCFLVE